jgi:hypothetical protein
MISLTVTARSLEQLWIMFPYVDHSRGVEHRIEEIPVMSILDAKKYLNSLLE